MVKSNGYKPTHPLLPYMVEFIDNTQKSLFFFVIIYIGQILNSFKSINIGQKQNIDTALNYIYQCDRMFKFHFAEFSFILFFTSSLNMSTNLVFNSSKSSISFSTRLIHGFIWGYISSSMSTYVVNCVIVVIAE